MSEGFGFSSGSYLFSATADAVVADEADDEAAAGGFVAGAAAVDDGEFVAGAAIGTPAFGAISDISMSPADGFMAVITADCGPAGGSGAGGFNKAELISPLSESNAAFTLSAKLFASKAVDMAVVCAATTCFK